MGLFCKVVEVEANRAAAWCTGPVEARFPQLSCEIIPRAEDKTKLELNIWGSNTPQLWGIESPLKLAAVHTRPEHKQGQQGWLGPLLQS